MGLRTLNFSLCRGEETTVRSRYIDLEFRWCIVSKHIEIIEYTDVFHEIFKVIRGTYNTYMYTNIIHIVHLGTYLKIFSFIFLNAIRRGLEDTDKRAAVRKRSTQQSARRRCGRGGPLPIAIQPY